MLNSRAQLVKTKRDLENQFPGLLKNLGPRIGKAGGRVFRHRVENLVGERLTDFPLQRDIGGRHFIADLTLRYGPVLYDCLA